MSHPHFRTKELLIEVTAPYESLDAHFRVCNQNQCAPRTEVAGAGEDAGSRVWRVSANIHEVGFIHRT